MNKYLAHRTEDGREQTIEEHLTSVAELCGNFANEFGCSDQGYLIGLAHDIGKCSSEFQERLRGGRIVDHATAGAYECAKVTDYLPWGACCISGHHSGLPEVGNARLDQAGDPTLCGRLKKVNSHLIPEYEVPVQLQAVIPPKGYGNSAVDDSFIIRMLYSSLVDADYLDTERFMNDGICEGDRGDSLSVLQQRLDDYIKPWFPPKSEINTSRCDVLQTCIREGQQLKRGIYTLTVPTGGGKTIASVAFAINHAISSGLKRIIYVVPYTSIIEQTADVFRRVFGEKNVLEHHSNALYEINDEADSSGYSLLKATENWNLPIVITTAVQFFESLYSNRSSKCRKLHNIANSVVVFDEAQMIPIENLRPCVAAIAMLVKHFSATAVLCTATQPFLNDLLLSYHPTSDVKELNPKVEEMFRSLQRVTIQDLGRTEKNRLIERLTNVHQVLCIVNSRKSARELFLSLPEEGRFHLSTLMFPSHRREVLGAIKKRLREGKVCRVISTSLIEAGVDIDFPTVFREISGLDSILQAAGRCNREEKRFREESIVYIFDGISKAPRLLKINIGATREVINNKYELTSPAAIQAYFKSLRAFSDNKLDQYEIIDILEDGLHGCSLPLKTVAERFRLISENTKTVYVCNENSEDLIDRFRRGERSRDLFRRLGQFGVAIYEKHYLELNDKGKIEIIDEDSAILLDGSVYDSDTGIVLIGQSENGIFV